MIKQLEIENFRCFGKSTLSGFERVNLIGGQNNSGKTAFLEALYLNCSPRVETLMKLRGLSDEMLIMFPERIWNGLFLNHDNQLEITIRSITHEAVTALSRISCKLEKSESLYAEKKLHEFFAEQRQYEAVQYGGAIRSEELNNNELVEFKNILSKSGHLLAILELSLETEKFGNTSLVFATQGKKKIIERNGNVYSASFISSSEKITTHSLVAQYEQCYFRGYEDKLLEAFHLIDPSITGIRTVTSGEPTLYLSRKNQRPMSIALFGDAMNRVAHFALELINNQAGILLIDEIENGIHHSHQKQLWQWLFALAVELDVQIFATTHSLEMLTAFKEAAMGTQYESEVAYFEFARHVKTQQIISIKREIDNLDYAIEHKRGVRGV